MAIAITSEEMKWEAVVHPLSFISSASRPPKNLPIEFALRLTQHIRTVSPAVSLAIQNPPDSVPELFDLFEFTSSFAAMVLLDEQVP